MMGKKNTKTKTETKEVWWGSSREKLEEILADLKAGKLNIGDASQHIAMHYASSLDFARYKAEGELINLAQAQFMLVESMASEQHKDLQELIKVVKEAVKK